MRILCLALILVLGISFCPMSEFSASAEDMPYRIELDLTNQIVTIYQTSDNAIVRQMLCSAGLNDATPTGTFTMPTKLKSMDRTEWYHFKGFGCYAKWASRVYKGIMFHSITYNRKNEASISKTALAEFGNPASHGCIRLRVEDAKFICDNCLPGTKVKIFKSGEVDEELRALLKESTYTNETGMTYPEFLGVSDEPGVLCLFSTGREVEDLQYRLRMLGYFTADIDGNYRTSTVAAVKKVQRQLGYDQTGYTNPELLEAIYSPDVPTTTDVKITEGMSGPIVRTLQQNLTSIGLYDGEIDGFYDVDVVNAVKNFQEVYGYTSDGIASSELQEAVAYELNHVSTLFDGETFTVQQVTDTIAKANVVSPTSIRIRSEASTKSDALSSVNNGKTVFVIEEGDEWTKVRYGKTEGYMKNKYLERADQNNTVLSFTSASGKSYTLGHTLEEYSNGAKAPADSFEDIYASIKAGRQAEAEAPVTTYATINTGSDDTGLNLRSIGDSSGDVVAVLRNGTKVEVLLKNGDWTYITSSEGIGYLMTEYLEFWTGEPGLLETVLEDDSADSDSDDDDDEAIYATVLTDKATVYDLDSEDANVLGTLKHGVQVTVIHANEDEDWAYVEYKGNRGYMLDSDLKFNLAD